MLKLLAIRLGLRFGLRLGPRREAQDLLMVSLDRADPETRARLARFELPAVTRIGYVGRIRPLARRGESVFRRSSRQHATAGYLVRTDRGSFLTTAGHLGAEKGEAVYRGARAKFRRPKWSLWGNVEAVTSPERPDAASSRARGLDIAAITTDGTPPEEHWHPVAVGDPRRLRFKEYICWTGGETGFHEGWLTVTAAAVKAIEDDDEYGHEMEYEHALMVNGNPPRFGGKEGDSGSAMYDRDGRLLGHLVGTDGARQHGIAPSVWFQMIDIADEYLEEKCGPINDHYGAGGT